MGSPTSPLCRAGQVQEWKISYKSSVKRMAILVSKQDHCLYDLLIRFKSGELPNCELPVIISNHPDLEPVAKMFGVEFRCLPIAEKGEGRSPAVSSGAGAGRVQGAFCVQGPQTHALARSLSSFSQTRPEAAAGG